MKIQGHIKRHEIRTKDLVFEVLESGDIFRIGYHHNQINLLKGNLLDGGTSNLYLRVEKNGVYVYQPLIGVLSKSVFEVKENSAIYQGVAFGIKYQVALTVYDNRWYYDVFVPQQHQDYAFDIVYGQDVAIASLGSILSSESYTAQYIDHQVFESKLGYTILSRQNQGEPQILQIGSLTPNVGYATDGFQVFGLSYKETNQLEALQLPQLPNKNYQYEFPYITLQSETYDTKKDAHISFYGYYEPHHEIFEKQVLPLNHKAHKAVKSWYTLKQPQSIKTKVDYQSLITGRKIDKKVLDERYPNKRHVERKGQNLLSFFTDNHAHVVLKDKELLVERPHGHLLIHGDLLHASEHVMASTNFMTGVFGAHVVLGNTNFHRLNGVSRNALNVSKISGQRIFIKKDGAYHLLGLPSVYEIGINYAKWIYVLDDDILEITAFASLDQPRQQIHFESLHKKTYDIILTNQLTIGGNEYERDIDVAIKDKQAIIYTTSNDMIQNHYPYLKYVYQSDQVTQITDDQVLFGQNHNYHGILSFVYEGVSSFKLDLAATYKKEVPSITNMHLDEEQAKMIDFIDHLTGIKVNHQKDAEKIEKLSDIVFWYTHNALIHYASPHGLEQYNGAAWGTRDVCQGPVELFSAAQRYDIVREILLKTFSRQFIETGDFPQWFMFDKYYAIQAHESHGDIIIWPIKALSDYLMATKDITILDEKVPFMSMQKNDFVKHEQTLKDHVYHALATIKQSFIDKTALPAYGGGDWDDTLQPANQKLTSHMVSGWTAVLLYQALHQLAQEIKDNDQKLYQELDAICQQIKKDFDTYLVKDQVPAGFVVFEDNHLDYLLHPSDQNTGLKYRLLPLTRGMIASFYDQKQVAKYHQIINQHLKHPDGVRLMDTAVTYRGGQKTYFSRAETAANFGREIGILYVHAHIRYIEAMAKIGQNEAAFEALETINPISITKVVKNAQLRQSNVYFSSSDANFYDRYEAKRDFEKVRKGEIEVKGGWRLYSSGPGIYINQLIRNILGIRLNHLNLEIDPIVPQHLDGIEITYHYLSKPLTLKINYGKKTHLTLNGEKINVDETHNPYRKGGFIIPVEKLKDLDHIDIDLVLST